MGGLRTARIAEWLAAGLLLDAGSALAKGGQVMFCPQPLLQLPQLPSNVVPECAACLEKQSGQTAPL